MVKIQMNKKNVQNFNFRIMWKWKRSVNDAHGAERPFN